MHNSVSRICHRGMTNCTPLPQAASRSPARQAPMIDTRGGPDLVKQLLAFSLAVSIMRVFHASDAGSASLQVLRALRICSATSTSIGAGAHWTIASVTAGLRSFVFRPVCERVTWRRCRCCRWQREMVRNRSNARGNDRTGVRGGE